MAGLDIRPCDVAQRPAVLSLLAGCGLPEAGLSDHWDTTWVAVDRHDPTVVLGSVALEVYGEAALLRSLAALEERRARGLGTLLFDFAMARASDLGLKTVALLTTTAEPFFARRGFVSVSRDAVPSSLRASVEFRGACPASAQAMLREVR